MTLGSVSGGVSVRYAPRVSLEIWLGFSTLSLFAPANLALILQVQVGPPDVAQRPQLLVVKRCPGEHCVCARFVVDLSEQVIVLAANASLSACDIAALGANIPVVVEIARRHDPS